MVPNRKSRSFAAVHRWLQSPLGQALQETEASVVEQAFDGIFGEYCLQLGLWGEPRAFLKFPRIRRTACLADPDSAIAGLQPDTFGQLHLLPVASDTVDAVILPHTLEFSARPHAILREVHRVLRSDGHLIILGFKPGGLWGMRRLLPGIGLPPAAEHLFSERRLTDWLELLDLRIHSSRRYFFRLPISGSHGSVSPVWERRGRRWWPELAACYILKARKRLVALTPVRKPWLAPPKVVGGLEPTARVIHVRFDR